MRISTTVGVGLLVCGALLLGASSGAFDLMTADRGVEVETATDENALLGINYDDDLDDRTLELERDNADGGGGCFFGLCGEYEYDDRDLIVFEDNSASGSLTIDNIETTTDNEDIVGGNGLRTTTDRGIAVVRGDFRCPSNGFLGSGDQGGRSATVTIEIIVNDGTLSVDLERELTITCVPE